MSMFSGFTNQISGWVATKTGHPHPEGHEVDPNAEQQPIQEQVTTATTTIKYVQPVGRLS